MNDLYKQPPEPIPDHVAACLEYVRRAVGVELDFTPETLPVLDHYAGVARSDLATRPGLEPLLALAVGAYFGEVVRARVPSFWSIPAQNVHDFALCFRNVYLSFNPMGVAYDTLHAGTEHGGPRSMLRVLPEDNALLEARLAALPPVPEEDYYLLTTRFEVIEVAVEALHARLVESGYGDSDFDLEDYAPGA